MDKRLLVSVFAVSTLLAICFPYAANHMFHYLAVLFKEDIDVAICILSSRDHFEHRDAIRETWLSNLRSDTILGYSVKAWFMVGETCCTLPMEDRLDEYDCHPWNPEPRNDSKDVAVFSGASGKDPDHVVDLVASRLAVKVLHPVVLKRIGILAGYGDSVTVTLWNGLTDEELITVSFSEKDRGIEYHGYRYQAIQPMILPKGFECELATNQSAPNPRHAGETGLRGAERIATNDEGVLLVQKLNDDRTNVEESTSSISVVSIMFAVNDVDQLNTHIENRYERQRLWQDKMAQDEEKLKEESAIHGDVVSVGVLDVYRNLPQKLLQCHQWISDHFNVKYVLKTDDDCFVDIQNILSSLKKIENRTKVWWGSFRDEWLVERYGKWKERSFASSVFSKFACGSGSVVFEDLHQWLATNSDYLHAFEGEDVAMGIWLAAINPSYIQDSNWKCDKTCTTGLYTLPELTPQEMRRHWRNKINCDDPCKTC
ncbi:UDP-GalNAc:beta-1,3-N-acetylgalactosaminyltransferase 2-like [Gigantopelta aegis]|uniref:UDP-GalNAc:beta-1, 3-N-acetylgalactosaminyltransferase 2-like n=1 Tax=Gigantopelta aegis TaxID=1735272 RepID=UPI001B88E571|nr:UDP-GalNAc:beta-1,3-N-acetylgalactosaminyltransferase 2-like [Gigantopelta aegis]